MAIDDDPLLIHARQIKEDTSAAFDVGRSILTTTANVVLPHHIGDYLTGLLGVVSQKRWNARVAELLGYFSEEVVRLKEHIKDGSYFGSEEFQALLYEAIDQERTNKFEQKRRMLALGLANSGTASFEDDEDKELYLRCLRDLRLSDVGRLVGIRNSCSRPRTTGQVHREVIGEITEGPFGEDSLRRLEGLGLLKSAERVVREPVRSGKVEEMAQRLDQMTDAINKILSEKRSTVFQPTQFGLRFLNFVVGSEAMRAAQD